MNLIASEVGEALYSSGCLKFGSFRIKSGALSPYYIDLACLLSSPKNLCTIADIAADRVKQLARSVKIDKLASIELKGALLLPSISCRANLPCTVVRKEEKAYGVTGRMAGAEIIKGEHVLFFDDVVSDGLSKLEAIKPIEQLGARVEDILIVVDREQGGRQKLETIGYRVHALAKISEIVESLLEKNFISKTQADAVRDYIKKI